MHWLLLSAKKPCLIQLLATCSKRPFASRKSAMAMPGWSSFIGASQVEFTSPTLQLVVDIERPLRPFGKTPVRPNAVMPLRMPSLTSRKPPPPRDALSPPSSRLFLFGVKMFWPWGWSQSPVKLTTSASMLP